MDQFVTCNGLDCSVCSLLETASVLFRWLLGISALLASLILIIGGFIYIFSIGKKHYSLIAKRAIDYVLIGFIFVLVAFISVHSIIWIIGGSSKGGWWNFECIVNTNTISSNQKIQRGVAIPQLATEIADNAPMLTNISSLNELTNSDYKTAILSVANLSPENLRQDLLSMGTGEKIKLLLKERGVTPEELATYIKLQNGFVDNTTDKYNINDLSKKIQDIVGLSKDDGDLAINANNSNLANLKGSYWSQDPSVTDKLNSIISYLGQSGNDVVAYKNARFEGSLSSCIDTGGNWKEFRNECLARSAIHGQENLKCSALYNPAMGCECPEGNYLVRGVCVKKEDFPNKAASIAKSENPDSCSGVTLVERTCPATRCEGTSLTVYPKSGKDQCVNGMVKEYFCSPVSPPQHNATCDQIKNVASLPAQENIAKQDPSTYNKLKDYFNRSNPSNNPDSLSNAGNTGATGSTGNTNTGGDRTGGDQTTGNTLGDLGPGNYNPSPSATALAECIGFKDGKIPYNGVLVTLLNKDDPTNAQHPKNNASRLFYLDRFGNVIGNAGDKNAGGLKVGPWTKGSGGTTWSPEWVLFNARTVHVNGTPDPWSFKSGQGYRVGPKGEGMNSNGSLNPNGKPQGMSGCNMHSGNTRSHSAGCMTMGGNERKEFTDYVKKMASQSGNNVLMAVLPAENTDPNSQAIKSDYCGNMDPRAAINKFKTLSQYSNYDPMQGY